MSASTITLQQRRATWAARATDVMELTKPRISGLVLVTVAVSGFVARWGQPDPVKLFHALIGTILVAASASALNQWMERRADAKMDRTSHRPLPAGRLAPQHVLRLSCVAFGLGELYLLFAVNGLVAVWALLSWLIYVGIYTPLKSRTPINTLIGAVAGAMPVLIGWSAAGGEIHPARDPRGAALFLLVFLWQFPHFMAIAWIYRHEYRRAGILMSPVVDPTGRRAGVQAILGALALLPVSFVPAVWSHGTGAIVYLIAAFVLGTAQLLCAWTFFTRINEAGARLLLRASLIYLPTLLAFLVLIHLL